MSYLRTVLGSAGKRALGSTREGFSHLKAALANLKAAESKAEPAAAADDAAEAEVRDRLSERGISSQLLRISALAVALKALHYLVDRKWLQTATSAGSILLGVPLWIWSVITSLALVPIVCALAMAVVTWCTVFLDRYIPGVSPPCPASTNKRWFSTPSTFHLGHTIAVVNGFLLLFLIYCGGVQSPSL